MLSPKRSIEGESNILHNIIIAFKYGSIHEQTPLKNNKTA